MRRLTLALLVPVLLTLASCKNVPESVDQAMGFCALIDSSKFDSAYDRLVDDEKALVSKTDFVKLLSDSLRVPGFDSTDEWSVVSSQGAETKVRAHRRAPDWEKIDEIKSRKSRRDLLKGLAADGAVPLHRDTNRVVTVVTTPAGPRFRVGLKDLIAFQKAKNEILSSLASKVTVKLKSGVAENNFQSSFHVTGTVKNESDIDLKPIVFQVSIHGKLSGTTTLTDPVPAKGTYSKEMMSDYENGLTPQKFGTNFDHTAASLGGLSAKVVSAAPANRRELDRMTAQAAGLKSIPSLF